MGEADSEVGVLLLNGSILESYKLLERECDWVCDSECGEGFSGEVPGACCNGLRAVRNCSGVTGATLASLASQNPFAFGEAVASLSPRLWCRWLVATLVVWRSGLPGAEGDAGTCLRDSCKYAMAS